MSILHYNFKLFFLEAFPKLNKLQVTKPGVVDYNPGTIENVH